MPDLAAALLGLFAVITMAAGIFLLINARAVVRVLRGPVEAGPKAPGLSWHTPGAHVRVGLLLFVVGAIDCMVVYTIVILGGFG